jgi:glycosyltransferase involved in cell wall biosynthesis
MRIGINASNYPLMQAPPQMHHGTEREWFGLLKHLPAHRTEDLTTNWWDAVIVGDEAQRLVGARSQKRVLRAIMGDIVLEPIDTVDHVVFVSETQRQIMQNRNPNLDPIITSVLPFATDIKQTAKKVPKRILWGSSPDRGLHHALRIFRKLHKKDPETTLEITYNRAPMANFKWMHNALGVAVVEMEADLDQPGVIDSGALAHKEMNRAISEAEVLLYPCDTVALTETYCVTILEAMACNTIPLFSDADALTEYQEYGPMLELPIKDEQWVEMLEYLLADKEAAEKYRRQGRRLAAERTWAKIARRWHSEVLND